MMINNMNSVDDYSIVNEVENCRIPFMNHRVLMSNNRMCL